MNIYWELMISVCTIEKGPFYWRKILMLIITQNDVWWRIPKVLKNYHWNIRGWWLMDHKFSLASWIRYVLRKLSDCTLISSVSETIYFRLFWRFLIKMYLSLSSKNRIHLLLPISGRHGCLNFTSLIVPINLIQVQAKQFLEILII